MHFIFCVGETFLWSDEAYPLRDHVKEAKTIGFLIVNTVTNGTYPLNLPEADLILLSLDRDIQHHNEIRFDTYDILVDNIEAAISDHICFYMAINQINQHCIENVCTLVMKKERTCCIV